ncbi:uncharacterized protein NDAI_0F04050 [Naumovozyma dairenensis CBS 421]|uniref:Hyphally-regulated cell wall protein N-terminal domain-containing protein n=1 Tax=Naumovozyma dairenensis (strain ATCC 10597 / BCRC 20456 / CBS 421 / NBRC 0211 / NRRL Y-12639) TaxID=1071378 RepID=G0WD62_NAUDC|nr:hypothetical protein NDAI_0F04050 [Naumovozyma dairenensis CBS 421]CCD25723.1 hypothetical protein NDAI_0F04050 [Naumovozyma dairenensis CBS 421]
MFPKYYILFTLTTLIYQLAAALDITKDLNLYGSAEYTDSISIGKGLIFAISGGEKVEFQNNLHNNGDLCVGSHHVHFGCPSLKNDGNLVVHNPQKYTVSGSMDFLLTDFLNNGFLAIHNSFASSMFGSILTSKTFINIGVIHIETSMRLTLGASSTSIQNKGTMIFNGGNYTLDSSIIGGGCIAMQNKHEIHIDISKTFDQTFYCDSYEKEIHFTGLPNLIGLPIVFNGFSNTHELYFHGSQTARTHFLVGKYSPLTGLIVIVTTPIPFRGAWDVMTRSIFVGYGYDMFQFKFEFISHRGLPCVHVHYNKPCPHPSIPPHCNITTGLPWDKCTESASSSAALSTIHYISSSASMSSTTPTSSSSAVVTSSIQTDEYSSYPSTGLGTPSQPANTASVSSTGLPPPYTTTVVSGSSTETDIVSYYSTTDSEGKPSTGVTTIPIPGSSLPTVTGASSVTSNRITSGTLTESCSTSLVITTNTDSYEIISTSFEVDLPVSTSLSSVAASSGASGVPPPYTTTVVSGSSTETDIVSYYSTTDSEGKPSTGITTIPILGSSAAASSGASGVPPPYTTTVVSGSSTETDIVSYYSTTDSEGKPSTGVTTIPIPGSSAAASSGASGVPPPYTTTVVSGSSTETDIVSYYSTTDSEGKPSTGVTTIPILGSSAAASSGASGVPPPYTTTVVSGSSTETDIVSYYSTTDSEGKPSTGVTTIPILGSSAAASSGASGVPPPYTTTVVSGSSTETDIVLTTPPRFRR